MNSSIHVPIKIDNTPSTMKIVYGPETEMKNEGVNITIYGTGVSSDILMKLHLTHYEANVLCAILAQEPMIMEFIDGTMLVPDETPTLVINKRSDEGNSYVTEQTITVEVEHLCEVLSVIL